MIENSFFLHDQPLLLDYKADFLIQLSKPFRKMMHKKYAFWDFDNKVRILIRLNNWKDGSSVPFLEQMCNLKRTKNTKKKCRRC